MNKNELNHIIEYLSFLEIYIYDIETLPLSADLFGLGKQVIRHGCLQPNRDQYDIITIQYMKLGDKKVKNLSWIGKETSSKKIIEEFDKIVQKADILIGKNSDKFDSRHINTQRLLHGLPPMPDWGKPFTRDDLEKQIRKHFYLPSFSLDYLCKMLFKSGKDKMEFADWQNIRNYKEVCSIKEKEVDIKTLNIVCKQYYDKTFSKLCKEGKQSLNKMIKYGNKDVMDTHDAWLKVYPYITPRLNVGITKGHEDGNYLRCKHCGGTNIHKRGFIYTQTQKKQRFYCNDCHKYAGQATILQNGFGKIM